VETKEWRGACTMVQCERFDLVWVRGIVVHYGAFSIVKPQSDKQDPGTMCGTCCVAGDRI